MPFAFATGLIPGSPFFRALYPVYVRGEAHLVAHQGTQAAAEFQKISITEGSLSAIRSARWRIYS
jgi:hypothetical protein